MAEYLSKFTGVRVDSAVEKIPASLPTEDNSIIVINQDGTTGYTTLSSLGAGDVVASGNNAFTGNNTFAGSSTFNGDVTMAKTPTIPGYAKLADANTFGLNTYFPNGISFYSGDYVPKANELYEITKSGFKVMGGNTSGILVKFSDLTSVLDTTRTIPFLEQANEFTAANSFIYKNITASLQTTIKLDAEDGGITVGSGGIGAIAQYVKISSTGISRKSSGASAAVLNYALPSASGTLALTTDIASAVAGLAERNSSNEFTANNYFAYNKGIDIGEKSVAPPWLAIRNDETAAAGKIAFLYHDGNAENTQNVAYFPAQSGVIALTPTTAPTENSFVVYDTNFKPKWIKGNSVADSATVSGLEARLTKIETLLAPGLAETNPRALYWLLTE